MHDCFHQERHAGCAEHIINVLPYSGPENFLADGAINKWASSGLLTFQFTLPWGIWGEIKMVLNLHSSYIWTMQRPFQQQHKLILIWNSVCVFKSLCWFLLSMWMDILLSPVNGFFQAHSVASSECPWKSVFESFLLIFSGVPVLWPIKQSKNKWSQSSNVHYFGQWCWHL